MFTLGPASGHGDSRDALVALEIAASNGAVLSRKYPGDGFAIRDMFLLEDAGGQGEYVVAREDLDGFLENDHSVVELLIDEVDGASGNLDSVGECLLLRVEAGEGGKK